MQQARLNSSLDSREVAPSHCPRDMCMNTKRNVIDVEGGVLFGALDPRNPDDDILGN